MARAAIDRASFYIGNNIEIMLHPYSLELQMAFNPLGGRARIRIYGHPLQHWNRIDMCTLVSGFGYPLRVAPYFNNGNYEYLTMLIVCKKPGKIPLNLKLRVNPYKKKVRVELDGLLMNQGPPPPPNGGNNNGDQRGRSAQRDGRARFREGQPNRSAENYGRRGRDDHRAQRAERGQSSSGSNWTNMANQWINDLRNKLEAARAPIKESDKKMILSKELVLEQVNFSDKQLVEKAMFDEVFFFNEFMKYLVKEGKINKREEELGAKNNVIIEELETENVENIQQGKELSKGKGIAVENAQEEQGEIQKG